MVPHSGRQPGGGTDCAGAPATPAVRMHPAQAGPGWSAAQAGCRRQQGQLAPGVAAHAGGLAVLARVPRDQPEPAHLRPLRLQGRVRAGAQIGGPPECCRTGLSCRPPSRPHACPRWAPMHVLCGQDACAGSLCARAWGACRALCSARSEPRLCAGLCILRAAAAATAAAAIVKALAIPGLSPLARAAHTLQQCGCVWPGQHWLLAAAPGRMHCTAVIPASSICWLFQKLSGYAAGWDLKQPALLACS